MLYIIDYNNDENGIFLKYLKNQTKIDLLGFSGCLGFSTLFCSAAIPPASSLRGLHTTNVTTPSVFFNNDEA